MAALIKFENITKEYLSGEVSYKALKGISFEINAGEFLTIMGPSGSGKSTTMHILGGMDSASTGKYYLKGEDVSKLDDDELADFRNKEVGFVFQAFNLLPRTSVLDNVILPLAYGKVPRALREEKAVKALTQVGLEDKLQNKPNQISGGQMQRVAIARALVTEPSIILADEPTGNLDSKTSEEIMSIFQKLNEQGKTIILITHEPDIARYSKRIITLKDGEITSDKPNADRKVLL